MSAIQKLSEERSNWRTNLPVGQIKKKTLLYLAKKNISTDTKIALLTDETGAALNGLEG